MSSQDQMERLSSGGGCCHDEMRKAHHCKAMGVHRGPWSCTNYETKPGIVRCRSPSLPLLVYVCYVRTEVKRGAGSETSDRLRTDHQVARGDIEQESEERMGDALEIGTKDLKT